MEHKLFLTPPKDIWTQKVGFVLSFFEVSEGHHPRGTTLHEALRDKICLSRVLRGLCGGLFGGSAGSPRGLCGGPRDFPRVVTLSS